MSEFAGILRERVTFQHALDVPDGHGGKARSWIAMDSVWAHVDSQGVQERLVAGRITQQQKYEITCRTEHVIDPKWRAEWCGLLMAIVGVRTQPDAPDMVQVSAIVEREQ